MDINVALTDLRALAAHALDGQWAPGDMDAVAEELAEKFQNLDEWLSKGGFAPDAWQPQTVPVSTGDPDQYLVEWTVDIWADSPREAAEKAREMQQDTDPENISHVYRVNGEMIDLDGLDA